MKSAAWLLVFVTAFSVQLILEQLNLVDSIGLWYTVYCAVITTALLYALYALIGFVFRKLLRRQRL